jgi:hypothetical protein
MRERDVDLAIDRDLGRSLRVQLEPLQADLPREIRERRGHLRALEAALADLLERRLAPVSDVGHLASPLARSDSAAPRLIRSLPVSRPISEVVSPMPG